MADNHLSPLYDALTEYWSLSLAEIALTDFWHLSGAETPDEELCQRIHDCLFPMSWDELAVEQRQTLVLQGDFANDPRNQSLCNYWFDWSAQKNELQDEIDALNEQQPQTITERRQKSEMLAALNQRLVNHEIEGNARLEFPGANENKIEWQYALEFVRVKRDRPGLSDRKVAEEVGREFSRDGEGIRSRLKALKKPR